MFVSCVAFGSLLISSLLAAFPKKGSFPALHKSLLVYFSPIFLASRDCPHACLQKISNLTLSKFKTWLS
jgi:hypothetical protein